MTLEYSPMIKQCLFKLAFLICSPFFLTCSPAQADHPPNSTPANTNIAQAKQDSIINPAAMTLYERINPPEGFHRVLYPKYSFASYLQLFPLKADGSEVLLFNGKAKTRQDFHAAVLDIDVGIRDLQQCADAVMRLRAEYLWQNAHYDEIQFNFTNGFPAKYSRWRNGERIRVNGNEVSWFQTQKKSKGYADFRQYLKMVFAYAGTLSLAEELKPQALADVEVGDVFIQGGSPGHAVIVMDKAVHQESGEVLILLAQSYMPAQSIHILHNLDNEAISPWYPVTNFSYEGSTPEWIFRSDHLKKF